MTKRLLEMRREVFASGSPSYTPYVTDKSSQAVKASSVETIVLFF